ncbi:hypothetical protein DFH09DRAFT_1365071 [Mycena vulgaris]|nr:hypothetical protein DFH09DRAFT_1365071 [Mycena vulgaris]
MPSARLLPLDVDSRIPEDPPIHGEDEDHYTRAPARSARPMNVFPSASAPASSSAAAIDESSSFSTDGQITARFPRAHRITKSPRPISPHFHSALLSLGAGRSLVGTLSPSPLGPRARACARPSLVLPYSCFLLPSHLESQLSARHPLTVRVRARPRRGSCLQPLEAPMMARRRRSAAFRIGRRSDLVKERTRHAPGENASSSLRVTLLTPSYFLQSSILPTANFHLDPPDDAARTGSKSQAASDSARYRKGCEGTDLELVLTTGSSGMEHWTTGVITKQARSRRTGAVKPSTSRGGARLLEDAVVLEVCEGAVIEAAELENAKKMRSHGAVGAMGREGGCRVVLSAGLKNVGLEDGAGRIVSGRGVATEAEAWTPHPHLVLRVQRRVHNPSLPTRWGGGRTALCVERLHLWWRQRGGRGVEVGEWCRGAERQTAERRWGQNGARSAGGACHCGERTTPSPASGVVAPSVRVLNGGEIEAGLPILDAM